MQGGSVRAARRPPTWRAVFMLGGCLLLAGCGGGDQQAPTFAAPDYSYLPKLRLSVATISIEDHAQAGSGPGDLGPTAPVPPDQALQQMARDRLVAAGNSGSGVFTIDQASITGTGGGALDGRLAVHLDIIGANGSHAGYAEAHVSRQFVPGDAGADQGTRAQLYTLTQQMMQDMNVELEFQVRRSLRDWLVDASGAPIAGSVEQQNLPPPGSVAPPGSLSPGSGPTGPGAPVGTTPVGATPIGAAPVDGAPVDGSPVDGGPVALAPPPVPAAAAPNPTPAASPPVPSAVFPDGTPVPAAPQERSPPPGFLQPPAYGTPPGAPAGPNGY